MSQTPGLALRRSLIVGLLPAVVLAFCNNQDLKAWLEENVSIAHRGLSLLGGWLVLAAAVWPFLVTLVFFYVDRARDARHAPDQRGLLTLFDTIEDVVGEKRERFAQKLQEFREKKSPGTKLDGAAVFLSITQPRQQIDSIIEGVLLFFKGIQSRKDTSLRVSLIEVKNRHPVDFLCFFPRDKGPRSAIKDLDNPNSAAARAIKAGGIVVIEDIKSAANKDQFRVTDPSRAEEEGSMICYPVLDRSNRAVVLLVCLCSDVPRYFLGRSRKMYGWVFSKFANRLLLEYNLSVLKKLVEEA